ncbi:hypothetical protein IA69_22815 [Massilia sp. JS1662]|nr:EAL domain-containing protein [Massilia sp. JS1662]KGF79628.1 hypothetical protein IA69_22815 [Massilia sp. JS1662]
MYTLYTCIYPNASYRFFDGKCHDQLKARLERIRELRHALAADQFVMYYEPRVNLVDGSLTSLEALVRRMHPAICRCRSCAS